MNIIVLLFLTSAALCALVSGQEQAKREMSFEDIVSWTWEMTLNFSDFMLNGKKCRVKVRARIHKKVCKYCLAYQ